MSEMGASGWSAWYATTAAEVPSAEPSSNTRISKLQPTVWQPTIAVSIAPAMFFSSLRQGMKMVISGAGSAVCPSLIGPPPSAPARHECQRARPAHESLERGQGQERKDQQRIPP